jgi:prepilin-type N-terminal cleavage/methylation domain-containing protein
MKRPALHGFTLIELSVVLVIIGLLVGGIVAGKSMIRGSQVRSIAVDYQKYAGATYRFEDKYGALPGDMANATSYWGAAHANANTSACYDIASSGGTATCNGDGDGNFCAPFTQCYEAHRYWQHLANSGLIEGQFTGTGTQASSRTSGVYPGVNAPNLKIPRTTFQVRNLSRNSLGLSYAYDAPNITMGYFFGGVTCTSGCIPTAVTLTGEEAWNLDIKADDGRPAYGKIQSFLAGNSAGVPTTCATSATAASAEYTTNSKAPLCALMLAL